MSDERVVRMGTSYSRWISRTRQVHPGLLGTRTTDEASRAADPYRALSARPATNSPCGYAVVGSGGDDPTGPRLRDAAISQNRHRVGHCSTAIR
jgi:hypothetical protein